MLEPVPSTKSLKEDKKKQQVKKVDKIQLPEDWWEATDTFEPIENNNSNDVKVFELQEIKSKHQIKDPFFDASRGDYYTDNFVKNDYTYSKNKEKIFRYAFYAYLFVGLIFVYLILHFIAT